MALTLNDMIAMIQFRLGRRTDLATEIEREIRLAQDRLEKSPVLEPWFLVEEVEYTLPIGTTSLTLPSNFIRESEEKQIVVVADGVEVPLRRASGDEVNRLYQDSTGTPVVYVLSGTSLNVYPAADKEYTIRHTIASHRTELNSTLGTPVLENEWTQLAYSLLMNKALIALAQTLKNKVALADATADMNAAIGELQTQIIQREESNQTHQRGTDGDAVGGPFWR